MTCGRVPLAVVDCELEQVVATTAVHPMRAYTPSSALPHYFSSPAAQFVEGSVGLGDPAPGPGKFAPRFTLDSDVPPGSRINLLQVS